MKIFIFICAVAAVALGYHLPAPLNKDGTVADTKEVSLAKQEHFAKLAEAGGATPNNQAGYSSYIYSAPLEDNHYREDNHRYHGPPAPLNHDGTVAETPEVQHVKQERLVALAEAFAKAPHDQQEHRHSIWRRSVHHFVPSFTSHYHAQPAPLNHDGTVAETEEVKAAKAVHFAAHAKVHQLPSHNINHYETSSLSKNVVNYQNEDNHRYHGPTAPLNDDGTVAETPEVQHVKQERLAALAEAFAKAPQNHETEVEHKLWKRSGDFLPLNYGHYQGPPAPLNHDGTVAETDEVKHAKAVHFAAFSKVNHVPYHNQGVQYNQKVRNDYSHEDNHRYHGPPAPLNHDGTVAETPEVKHIKAEHLAAVAEAFAKAPRNYNKEDEHYEWETPKYENY